VLIVTTPANLPVHYTATRRRLTIEQPPFVGAKVEIDATETLGEGNAAAFALQPAPFCHAIQALGSGASTDLGGVLAEGLGFPENVLFGD
jgi:hypothetical protein